MAVTGRDLKLSESRIEGYRNFVTKIWNAAKYLEMNDCQYDSEFDISGVITAPNKWIIGKTLGTLDSINQSYSKFRFNDIANNLYNHTWGVFCDWYIEFSKALLNDENEKTVLETRKTLAWAFDACLKMLHPIMPFVTEELWRHFRKGEGLLSNGDWPVINNPFINEDQIKNIENVISFIEDIRSTKSNFNLVSGEKTELYVVDLQKEQNAYIKENEKISGIDYDEETRTVVVRTEKESNYEQKIKKKIRTSGCAVGTVFGDMMESVEEIILPESKIKVSWLYDLAKAINQINSLYLEVGAIHGTVLCLENKPLIYMEDVGRHNACLLYTSDAADE